MRESVSHLKATALALSPKLQWCVLVGLGVLTILTGIAVLIALMNPENLKAVPTIALVCVLILLCVPVPVLMLERKHWRSTPDAKSTPESSPTTTIPDRASPRTILHGSHTPHESNAENHRSTRTKTAIPGMESPLQRT